MAFRRSISAFCGEPGHIAGDIRTFAAIGVHELIFDFRDQSIAERIERLQWFATNVIPLVDGQGSAHGADRRTCRWSGHGGHLPGAVRGIGRLGGAVFTRRETPSAQEVRPWLSRVDLPCELDPGHRFAAVIRSIWQPQ